MWPKDNPKPPTYIPEEYKINFEDPEIFNLEQSSAGTEELLERLKFIADVFRIEVSSDSTPQSGSQSGSQSQSESQSESESESESSQSSSSQVGGAPDTNILVRRYQDYLREYSGLVDTVKYYGILAGPSDIQTKHNLVTMLIIRNYGHCSDYEHLSTIEKEKITKEKLEELSKVHESEKLSKSKPRPDPLTSRIRAALGSRGILEYGYAINTLRKPTCCC